ncbi:MAG: hypothetical protein HY852_21420 [Bradyrhizobium sp.]|uniref:hypothetical protein n=1 Tax=Bradyrhizobium sp. TaxID=376 RepID=UPI0025B8456A|nr:hypothetical protein [Bradyrhizobium sp.]MBI5264366.1 hypothetical protein [Bradyrhizobium sp.]
MLLSLANRMAIYGRARGLVPLCVGAAAYLFFLFTGDSLLQDSDSFWQIKIGQWVLDHHAVPQTDFYSFTRFGEPWISSSWLSQVLYAVSYAEWGWAGPVILASLAIAAAAAIFVHLLEPHLELPRAVLLVMAALLLSIHHLLARPHILALPVMVAWVGAMMAASDRCRAPSFLLLPVIALWANLHGGFVLGLALIGPVALEAVWSAERDHRVGLVLHWALFGVCAVVASCFTPYGWNTLLGAAKILNLGELLSLISEWRPADFSSFGAFEAALLALIGFAFYRGVVLSPPRILLLLGFIWMALTHVRSIEAFAFLVPLVLAKPLAGHGETTETADSRGIEFPPISYITALAALTIVVAVLASTSIYMGHHRFIFTERQTPVAAVDLLKQREAKRVFNAYEFGGYLISRDVPVFVDGRAELYGEKFVMDFFNAVEARKVDTLLGLLDRYKIDATLLVATAPAAKVLDHVQGWKRLYADGVAVIHVRTNPAGFAAPAPETAH